MKVLLLGTLFALCSLSLASQPLTDEQHHLIDSLVTADVRPGSPGLAVGIVQNGQVIYSRCAGLADLETEIEIDPDTRFNLASTGKQFTAFTVLRLIQEGKVSLDDKLEVYFPEFDPRLGTVLTVRHLLTHTSGLRDQNSLWSLQGISWWKHSFSNADVLTMLARQTTLNFEPGSQYSYSNANYVMLAELVARVTGKDFAQYTQALLQALGMEASAHEPDHTAIGPMAKPYFQWDTWDSYDWLSDVVGDGAFFSSLNDQMVWERTLQEQTEDWVSASQSLIPEDEVRTYGYGLEFSEFQGRPLRYHDGSTGAWKATTWRFDDPQLSIVVMTNSGAIVPSMLARQLAEVMLGTFDTEKVRFPLGPETVGAQLPEETWLGTYQIGADYFYRFVKRDGGYWLERPDRNPVA
ncbi:MAG: serine hydrolase domain-containing protein, partial [Bacteroidota bacterium]